MNKQYLDYEGLEVLWGKIKSGDESNSSRIEELKKEIAFEADNYTDALAFASSDNIGKNIIVKNTDGTHQAGPYIIMGEHRIQCLLCDTEAEVGEIQSKLDELVQEINSMSSDFEDRTHALEQNLNTLQKKDEEILKAIEELENAISSDFSGFYTKTEVDELLEYKMDNMEAISVDEIESLS